MCRVLYLTVLIILNYVRNDEAARILGVFPTPSISHHLVFRPLIQELVNRGHELTVITTDPMYPKDDSPKNLTEIDVHDMSYAEWEKFVATSTGKKTDSWTQLTTALELITLILEKQIQTEEVQHIIHNKDTKFDLILAEGWVRPTLVFSHLFNAPLIQVSSLGPLYNDYKVIGAPNHPLLYPISTHKRVYNLTMWEKILELYEHYWLLYYYDYYLANFENEIFRRNFGDDVPSMSELQNNVHMIFWSIHPIWQGNTPVPPSVVFMGGVHQKPEKPLPKELKEYLDSSVNGVIYMSFGTNTDPSSLPPEKIQLFVKVFSQLPYDILWKWNKDVLPGQTENIRIGKWFPQADLLRHPKVKLFITQGGLQSTDEAITAGVPLLGVPMLVDQWFNVEKYVHHKIGLQLNIETLTEEELKNSIDKITADKSYRDNVARMRALMHDQPQAPLERAVWWIEHVLRHGGAKHLRAPAANMQWTHYYEIELVMTLLGCVALLVLVCVFTVYQLYKWVRIDVSVKAKVS